MTTRRLRDLAEAGRRALKSQTARQHRWIEAEARTIPSGTVHAEDDFVGEWLDVPAEFRGDLDQPERSTPRQVDIP